METLTGDRDGWERRQHYGDEREFRSRQVEEVVDGENRRTKTVELTAGQYDFDTPQAKVVTIWHGSMIVKRSPDDPGK